MICNIPNQRSKDLYGLIASDKMGHNVCVRVVFEFVRALSIRS